LVGGVFLWGYAPVKSRLDAVPGAAVTWPVPHVQGVVKRNFPVVETPKPDKAEYKCAWLSAAGTGIFLAAIFAGVVSRMSGAMWRAAAGRPALRPPLPLLTILRVLAVGCVTKYRRLDPVTGLAFSRTGW